MENHPIPEGHDRIVVTAAPNMQSFDFGRTTNTPGCYPACAHKDLTRFVADVPSEQAQKMISRRDHAIATWTMKFHICRSTENEPCEAPWHSLGTLPGPDPDSPIPYKLA